MSKYTTGEIARISGVSVRTVQYYDDRGILKPSELSEGGRRLYSKRSDFYDKKEDYSFSDRPLFHGIRCSSARIGMLSGRNGFH